jgi:hypothetical protein
MSLIERVCRCFNANKVNYAVVGGYAVALHGVPRGTIDLDVIVSVGEESFINVEASLRSIGLIPRLPVTAKEVYHFRKEYIENRNLIAWSFYNPLDLSEIVDIIITENCDDVSTVEKQLANFKIKLVAKTDLLKMKRKSGRLQDLVDIAALEKV